MSVSSLIQFRRDTAANWTASNPTLASGEMGLELDTQLFKIGNGYTSWNLLPYGGLRGATGPGGSVAVSDEGNVLTNATTNINFIGAGVTATNVGSVVTVNIPGGGGSGGIGATGATGPAGTVTFDGGNAATNYAGASLRFDCGNSSL